MLELVYVYILYINKKTRTGLFIPALIHRIHSTRPCEIDYKHFSPAKVIYKIIKKILHYINIFLHFLQILPGLSF